MKSRTALGFGLAIGAALACFVRGSIIQAPAPELAVIERASMVAPETILPPFVDECPGDLI